MTLIEQIVTNLDLLHKHELTVLDSLFYTGIVQSALFDYCRQKTLGSAAEFHRSN